ncbi:MAG TPA: OmpW family outer membrane protein [Thermoanaerobaculia bacterium]|jgi:outer membrane protein W
MKKLFLLTIALFATPAAVSAQTLSTSDAAIWITASEFNDPSITDSGETLSLELDEDTGYGVSFNHFWFESFSTEFAYHRFGGDVEARLDDGPRFDAGEVDASSLTAIGQWHFRRAARFSPYVGAGAAYMSGQFDPTDFGGEDDVAVDFENEFTWAANFGANIGLTESLSLGLDAKVLHWEPREEGDDASDRVELSPVLLSAGLRYRF